MRGMTLVESLAALLLSAVAVIGISALYLERQRVERAGETRTTAAALAATMAEQIRDGAYRTGYENLLGAGCTTDTPKDADAAASQRTACWQDQVAQLLPNGSGSVLRERGTTPPTYTIAVSWSDPTTGAASYVTRAATRAAN
jgi:type IV pilus modification protein PilV